MGLEVETGCMVCLVIELFDVCDAQVRQRQPSNQIQLLNLYHFIIHQFLIFLLLISPLLDLNLRQANFAQLIILR